MTYFTNSVKLLLVGIALFISTVSISQNITINSATITSSPASYCTNTMLQANVTIFCINGVHAGNTVSISGSVITVNINYTLGSICLGALANPVHNVNLGMIPQGTYTVNVIGTWNAVPSVNSATTSLSVGAIGCCPAQASFTTTSDTVCVGDMVSYTNTSIGSISHEWFENSSTAGTQQNYSKTYNTPGTYLIELVATDGNCSSTATQQVLVSAYPTVDLGNDTTTCPDNPITLDAGSGRDAILWSTNTTTRFQQATTAGTYSVTVTENGCDDQDTIVVSFFPAAPALNLGNDTMICYGDSIMLDATAPGVTYVWHDNSTGPTYYADTVGNYSVVIEDGNTCKNTDDINVSLFSAPVISMSVVPRNTLCYGTPYEFRANAFTQGSTMFQWKINTINAGSPTSSNTFNPNLMYGDSVNVDLLTDVCSSTTFEVPSNHITMYLKPEPKLISGSTATDTVIENTSKNYLVPVISGSTFTWSAVGGTIASPIGNAASVDWGTAMDTAKIMVTEKDAGNCSFTNVRNVFIMSIVGVKDENNLIGIGYAYPNPANNSVTIPVVIDGTWDIDLSLYDITGNKVKAIYNGAVSGNRDFTFSIDDLQNGMYFYKITTSDGFESVKKLNINH